MFTAGITVQVLFLRKPTGWAMPLWSWRSCRHVTPSYTPHDRPHGAVQALGQQGTVAVNVFASAQHASRATVVGNEQN
jgi:hypothetical protein